MKFRMIHLLTTGLYHNYLGDLTYEKNICNW